MSNYEKYPSYSIKGHTNECIVGYPTICKELKSNIIKEDYILVVDTYPGVRDEEVIHELMKLNPALFVNMIDIFKSEETILEQMKYHLTDDRVFGKMYYGEIIDFIDINKFEKTKKEIENNDGLVIIYGFGASLLSKGDCLVYADLARWEIQMRYRNKMSNYKASNMNDNILSKYKRSFFIEWRIADKHKSRLFDDMSYVLDTNKKNDPKMISGKVFREGLIQLSNQPFRTVPYFDPGVWGGQWMKEICDLDKQKENYAWSFDGVPEENSLLFKFENCEFELPAMDLILYQPKQVLGNKVFARFGAEFPIRFDFLDTMGGQNLSLQVHPLTEYIHREFGMAYTQDESYYILDAKEDAVVYLGLKEDINPNEMIKELHMANRGQMMFDADKYINKFSAKKHDHFLIPAGTCHCSGSNAMVLEISATPYIFTFKLWDWGRLGLDGLPRPVHIDHGEKVIQWDRTTTWVKENLVNAIREIPNDECYEEHTGLHELEFIETRRYWISGITHHDTKGTVNMLNLVEGSEAMIESTTGKFEPFVVHYAETFIIPAAVGKYTIKPYGNENRIGVIKAYVRDSFD